METKPDHLAEPDNLPELDDLPETDASRIKQCEGWFDESKSWMENQRQRWRLNEKLYNNDIEVPGARGATKLKFNLALAIIETEMPVMADYLPTFDIQPEEQDDQAFADMAQRRKLQLTNKCKLKNHIMDALHDGLKLSNGIVGLHPVLNEKGNLESFDPEVVDLFTWFPSPHATGMDIMAGEARYHIFAVPMHVDEIERIYGKKVSAEGEIDEYRAFKITDEGSDSSNNKYALVKEVYSVDMDMEAYPRGRITVYANGVLLDDGPFGYKHIPYFMYGNYKSAHSLFGIGEPELVKTQIKALNQVMSNLADLINKSGNPIRKIVRSLWTQMTRRIAGVAGEEIVVDRPNDVTWDVPPNVPAHTFQFLELLLQLIDVVSGVHDVSEGKRPAGITAASAIVALQEAAQRRVRYKLANGVTRMIEEMGGYFTEILQKHDKEIRSIREQAETGGFAFNEYDPVTEQDGKTLETSSLEVEVVAGSRLPSGRAAAEARAIEMFTNGIYGIEDVVRHLADTEKEELINNYYKRQGMEELAARQDELNAAFEQFGAVVGQILQDPEGYAESLDTPEGTEMENGLVQLIQQYPELLHTQEWGALPTGIKKRLLVGHMASGEGQAA